MRIEKREEIALISIITPLFNKERYIGETIDSVLNQTFKDWELLIIDDGSTDVSVQIVNEYVVKDKRIKLYKRDDFKQNKGASYFKNHVILKENHNKKKYINNTQNY